MSQKQISIEDANKILRSINNIEAIQNGQEPVKPPSGASRHYQKNLLKNVRKSTLDVPTNYIDDIFKERNAAYSGKNIFLINGS